MPNRRRFGDIDDFSQNRFERRLRIFLLRRDSIFDVDEPHDIVEIVSIDGIARMTFFESHRDEVVER